MLVLPFKYLTTQIPILCMRTCPISGNSYLLDSFSLTDFRVTGLLHYYSQVSGESNLNTLVQPKVQYIHKIIFLQYPMPLPSYQTKTDGKKGCRVGCFNTGDRILYTCLHEAALLFWKWSLRFVAFVQKYCMASQPSSQSALMKNNSETKPPAEQNISQHSVVQQDIHTWYLLPLFLRSSFTK